MEHQLIEIYFWCTGHTAPRNPRFSSTAAPHEAAQEDYAPAPIDTYAAYDETMMPDTSNMRTEINVDLLNSSVSPPGEGNFPQLPPFECVQYNPGAANVVLVTGVVLQSKQESASLGSYALSMTLAVPAYGSARAQHVQVIVLPPHSTGRLP